MKFNIEYNNEIIVKDIHHMNIVKSGQSWGNSKKQENSRVKEFGQSEVQYARTTRKYVCRIQMVIQNHLMKKSFFYFKNY